MQPPWGVAGRTIQAAIVVYSLVVAKIFCRSVKLLGGWAKVKFTGRYDNISFKIKIHVLAILALGRPSDHKPQNFTALLTLQKFT